MGSVEVNSQSPLQVVAGIIRDESTQRILIAKRPEGKHKAGFWEFPGGKIENNESSVDALRRELEEEISLRFSGSRFFQTVCFSYQEKTVELHFFEVFGLLSDVCANEGQEIRWVPVETLSDYAFPEANLPIIQRLMGR